MTGRHRAALGHRESGIPGRSAGRSTPPTFATKASASARAVLRRTTTRASVTRTARASAVFRSQRPAPRISSTGSSPRSTLASTVDSSSPLPDRFSRTSRNRSPRNHPEGAPNGPGDAWRPRRTSGITSRGTFGTKRPQVQILSPRPRFRRSEACDGLRDSIEEEREGTKGEH